MATVRSGLDLHCQGPLTCSGLPEGLSQALLLQARYRRVPESERTPAVRTGDNMSGSEPLKRTALARPAVSRPLIAANSTHLVHRPSTIGSFAPPGRGEPTSQSNRMGTAEQPHIARIVSDNAPRDRGAI